MTRTWRSTVFVSMLLGSLLRGELSANDDLLEQTEQDSVRPAAEFQVTVSKELFRNLIEQPVDRVLPVRQTILGTQVSGTGRTRGKVEVDFIPDATQGKIRIAFRGTTTTDAHGLTGRVRTTSVSQTSILSQAVLGIAGQGISHSPAEAVASTALHVCGVEVLRPHRVVGRLIPARLIERQAWKSIAKTRRQRENIIARQAERTAARRLDERLPPLAEAAHEKLSAWLLRPFASLDRPGGLRFSTTREKLNIVYPVPAGDLPIVDNDVWTEGVLASISVHEAVATELLSRYLAGTSVSPAAGSDGPRHMLRNVSAATAQAVRIRFAPRDPISVHFRNGCMRFRLRGDELVVSGVDGGEFEIDLRLCCEPLRSGVRLRPASMPQVAFTSAPAVSPWRLVQSHAIKLFLMTSCNRDVLLEGIELPTLAGPLCTIAVRDVSCRGGWLKLIFADRPRPNLPDANLLKVATSD